MKRDAVPSPAGLERLIEALRVLPGVGPRSAQRMATPPTTNATVTASGVKSFSLIAWRAR